MTLSCGLWGSPPSPYACCISCQVCGISCISPMAPVFEVIGAPLADMVWPPLSIRITALIQSSAIPKRRDASLMNGVQRSITDVPVDDSLAMLCVTAADAAWAGEPETVAAAMTQADSIAGQWRNLMRIEVLWVWLWQPVSAATLTNAALQ